MSEKRGSLSSSSLMLMTFTAVFSFGNIINNLDKSKLERDIKTLNINLMKYFI